MANILQELEIGLMPNENGITMFRKFDIEKAFQPRFQLLDAETLGLGSSIMVHYIEYFKNADGVETPLLQANRKAKHYIVPNQTATFDEENNPTSYEWLGANDWFMLYSYGGNDIPVGGGILEKIEMVLQDVLPLDCLNGAILEVKYPTGILGIKGVE